MRVRTRPKQLQYIFLSIFSVYLIYFPMLGNANLSIGVILFSLIGLIELLRQIKKRKFYVPQIIFLIFLIYMMVPLLYSTNINEGRLWLIKNIFSFLILAAGIHLGRDDKKERLLKYITIIGLPLSIANIVFCLFPEMESTFYKSLVSRIIVSPSSFEDIVTGNINDLNKAGTIFVNANNASVFYVEPEFWLYYVVYYFSSLIRIEKHCTEL